MADVCEKHKLVLADDGKCVVCRRVEEGGGTIAAYFTTAHEETLLSKAVTAITGACLIAGLATVVWLYTMPEERPLGSASGRRPQRAAAPVVAATDAAIPSPDVQAAAADEAAPAGQPSAQTPTTSAADDQAQRDALRAQQRAALDKALSEVSITMYATPWCFICDDARYYMRALEIQFSEYDVEADRAAKRRQLRLNKAGTVPTFEVDGEVMVGFSVATLDEARRAAAKRRLEQAGPQAQATPVH